MYPNKPTFLIVAVVVLFSSFQLNAQNSTTKSNYDDLPFDALSVSDRKKRDLATLKIVEAKRSLNQGMVMTLENMQSHPLADENVFGRPYAKFVWLLGEMRIQEAEGKLFDMVEFQLDPATVPVKRMLKAIEYYPAAEALIKINEKTSINKIFQAIKVKNSDLRLRIYTQLLSDMQGKDVALFMVQKKLWAEKVVLKKEKKVASIQQANLEKMKWLLENDKAILKIPTKKS